MLALLGKSWCWLLAAPGQSDHLRSLGYKTKRIKSLFRKKSIGTLLEDLSDKPGTNLQRQIGLMRLIFMGIGAVIGKLATSIQEYFEIHTLQTPASRTI